MPATHPGSGDPRPIASAENIAAGFELEDLAKNLCREVPEGWVSIASEVLWRKRTLMAAIHELRKRGISNAETLGMVDVFVEKAQDKLSDRAQAYRVWGIVTSVIAIAMLLAGVVVLAVPSIREPVLSTSTESWRHVVVGLFRSLTLGGLYVGAIVYLVFLSRALLHEMVVLYQRRHALRLGRLLVYLRPDGITVPEVLAAFNWNAEYRSAFMDIRAEKLVQGPVAVIASATDFVRAAADGVREAKAKVES